MKLIVGLGNPGKRYEKTRHNVGFMVLDAVMSQISDLQVLILNWKESKNAKALYCAAKIKDQKIELIKPLTFMNNSGHAVSYARNKHKVQSGDIYIVHDDLDIKLGEYKIQRGKGPKEHNGVLSIEEKLGFSDFWRVRIGVESRDSQNRISGEGFVLQNFSEEEKNILSDVLKKVTEDLIGRLRS